MANETINWYPGHMKKATRMMEDSLRLVDAVVELRDARIPNSSRNPDVERIVGSKPRLIVLNRADQADAAATALWKKALTGEGALAQKRARRKRLSCRGTLSSEGEDRARRGKGTGGQGPPVHGSRRPKRRKIELYQPACRAEGRRNERPPRRHARQTVDHAQRRHPSA